MSWIPFLKPAPPRVKRLQGSNHARKGTKTRNQLKRELQAASVITLVLT